MRVKFTKRSLVERNESHQKFRRLCRSIRHNRYAIFSLALIILIFLFSSQTGAESGKLSSKIYEFITLDERLFTFINIRKLAHFTLFGLLGGCIFTHLRFMFYFKSKVGYYIRAFALTLLYAGFDELHQYFVNGRGCSIIDVGIDCLGCAVALLINFIIISLLEHRHKKMKGN